MVLRAVLMKTGLRSLNTARPVNTAHPKTTIYSARPISHFSKSTQSIVKRPYQIRTSLTNKNFSQKVNIAKGKFYTARPNSAVVNAVRANQVNAVKASSCWVWRSTKLNSASITLKKHNYVDAQGMEKDEGKYCFHRCADKKNSVLLLNMDVLLKEHALEGVFWFGLTLAGISKVSYGLDLVIPIVEFVRGKAAD
ncbi:hypothetical protein Tco_0116221 [Tanacetum coccineum]